MALKSLTFDGRRSDTLGLLLTGAGTYNAPERDVEYVSIPGRSGDLVQDNGRFRNITVSYPVGLPGHFPGRAAALREWLLGGTGYRRLEDDYDPAHYRMAVYQGPLDFKTGPLNRAGEATLRFTCKPQRYLKSGEYPVFVGDGDVLYNPTPFPALPLLRVAVYGGLADTYVTFSLGAYTMRLLLVGNLTYCIDCEAEEIWSLRDDGSPYDYDCNNLLEYTRCPRLEPGENVIRLEGDLDKVMTVEIVPRWWTI